MIQNGGVNHGITAINILSGGTVIFNDNSIVDGGSGNTGIAVNDGGSLIFYSCHIANCSAGVIARGNSNISFRDYNNGRSSEFWNNSTAIFFENYTGTTYFNQLNIKIRNNGNGIEFISGSGTVNISNVSIYSNSQSGIVSTNGNINITGGSIYSNSYGIYQRNCNLNIGGGAIFSNNYGICLENGYSGKMTITNTYIHSNNYYAIVHYQNSDGSCTILGGLIYGKIYLGQNDNYVNTDSNYTRFEVTPSTYYFKRKLVKTSSNAHANNEIVRVTMTENR